MAHGIVQDKFQASMELMYKLQCAMNPDYDYLCIRGRIYVCRIVRSNSQSNTRARTQTHCQL